MSTLLRSVTAEETDDDSESPQLDAKGTGDDGGRSWRRRAVYATGGLVAILLYRRLRGRAGRNADSTENADAADVDTTGADTDGQRSLRRRLGGRAARLAAGFVAASVARRLVRRWQR